MEHLRWRVHTTIRFKPDFVKASMTHRQSTAETIQVEADTHADAWIESAQSTYRVQLIGLNDQNKPDVSTQEVFLRKDYAAHQDYDCRPQGYSGPWKVCFIHVIPTFGDSRAWDVNELQFAANRFWTRALLTGQLPSSYEGLPVHADGSPVLFKNFSTDSGHPDAPSVDFGFLDTATYQSGHLAAFMQRNGYDSKPLDEYYDIVWKDGKIVAFKRREASIQAQRLTLPATVAEYTLESRDSSPCPIELKQGAKVFDYRLCGPKKLNHFPDKKCHSHIYTLGPKGILSLTELQGTDQTIYKSESTKGNQTPFWVWLAAAALFIVGIASVLRARKQRAGTRT